MRERRLGSQGPDLSVVGFGAWEAGGGSEWGRPPPEGQVLNAIRSVFDCGIDWIDTAEVYGRGRSEELVGKAVAGRRDEVRLASKVAPVPEGSGFRAEQVRAACEESLRRLGTQHLDLYQLHWPDGGRIPVEETWAAMAGLVDDGLVRFIGVSNFDRDLIERCQADPDIRAVPLTNPAIEHSVGLVAVDRDPVLAVFECAKAIDTPAAPKRRQPNHRPAR